MAAAARVRKPKTVMAAFSELAITSPFLPLIPKIEVKVEYADMNRAINKE
jgi:hypothetical protein